MKSTAAIVIRTAAAALAAFGCAAVMAQTPGAPRAAPPPPANPAAPSAATPGTAGQTGTHVAVSREQTQRFVSRAAYANDAEIAQARFALAHSQSPEVQAFARRMIEDHTRAGNQLKHIAAAQGYAVPSGLSARDRTALMRLERQGSQFNAAYSVDEQREHRETVAIFKRAEQNPRIQGPVRDFARMTLPVLMDHLQLANKLVASQAGANRSAGWRRAREGAGAVGGRGPAGA